MARITDVSIKQCPAMHLLAIRKTIRFMEEYADFAGGAFAQILAYTGAQGLLPSDGPVTCFFNTDLEQLDVLIGFPYAKALAPSGDIQQVTIPAADMVTAIDLGPYEEQDPTLMDMFAWIKAQGLAMEGPIYYQYLNDTERPESTYLTKMMIPVERKGE